MKRARFSCLMAVCLGLVIAHPAHADLGGLFDYIGGLSGPGPFDRPKTPNVLTLDFVCLEAKRGNQQVEEALKNNSTVPLGWLPWCTGDLRAPRQSYGFLIGWYHTDRIPDAYKYSPEKQALRRDVTGIIKAIPAALTFNTTIPFVTNQYVLRAFDIGVTAGVIVFKSGEKDGRTLFNAFAVPLVEVPRVVVRPLAPFACVRDSGCPSGWKWWDLVEISFITRIIGGVTSEQFGAAPGVNSGLHITEDVRFGLSYKF
jgi:hypothetical protein